MNRRSAFVRSVFGGIAAAAVVAAALHAAVEARAASYNEIAQATLADPSPFDVAEEAGPAEPTLSIPEEAIAPMDVSAAPRVNRPPSPDWIRYSFAEALIMGRDNQAFNRPLVVNATTLPEETVLDTQDLQFPYGGGMRVFYGYLGPDNKGWEIGYFGLYDLGAEATTPPLAEAYSFPNFFGSPVSLSDGAQITSNTTINGVEANMFHHFERWDAPHRAWLEVDWLAGFRYIAVEDMAQIYMLCCEQTDSYTYRVNSRNNMFGGQIGGRARLNYRRWAFEGWGKAGILGNAQKQFADPVMSTITGPIRPAASATGSGVSMVADINLSAIYRLTDVWGIRMGFNTIWLGGVALAADQFDFTETSTSGTVLQGNGGMFLSGVNVGFEGRW